MLNKNNKYSLIVICFVIILALFINGCSKDSGRASVKDVQYDFVVFHTDLSNALFADDQKVKKDLDGKVVEVYGPIKKIDQYEDKNDYYMTFPIITNDDNRSTVIRCTIRNKDDANFKSVRLNDMVVVRGYASIWYNQKYSTAFCDLDDAEIIDIYKPSNDSNGLRGIPFIKYLFNTLEDKKLYH